MEENFSDINWLDENKEKIEKIINDGKFNIDIMSNINVEWLKENKDIVEKIIDIDYLGKYFKVIHKKIGYEWLKENKDILEKIMTKYNISFCAEYYPFSDLEEIGFDWLMQNKEFVIQILNNTVDSKYIPRFIDYFDDEWLKNNTDILSYMINKFGNTVVYKIEERFGREWLRTNTKLIEKTIDIWSVDNLINIIGKKTLQGKKELVKKIILKNDSKFIFKFVNELDKWWLQENKDIIKTVISEIEFDDDMNDIGNLIQKLDSDYLEENTDLLKEVFYKTDYLIIPTLVKKLDKKRLYNSIEEMEFDQREEFTPEKENLLVHLSIILEKSNKNWFDNNTDAIKEVINECDYKGYLLILIENINKEWLMENTDVAINIWNKVSIFDRRKIIGKLDKKILLSDDVIEVIREEFSSYLSNEDIKYVIENGRIDILIKEIDDSDSIVIPNYVRFKKLHNFEPSYEVLSKYPTDQIGKFNKKTWFSVAKHNIFQQSVESKNSLVEMSQLFGIFENDDKVQNRIQKIHEIATYLPKEISNDEMSIDVITNLKGYKYVTDIVRYYKVLDIDDIDLTNELTNGTRAENIRNELNFIKERLRDSITESEYQNLKEIAKRDVLLRKVLDQMYKKDEVLGLRLEKAPINEKELNELQERLQKLGVKDVITASKLHNIFDGSIMKYNPDFYDFIDKNFEEIIKHPLLSGKLSSISKEWDNIRRSYGVKDPTIEHCLRYYDEIQYENIGEEYDLAKVCKKME